MATRSGGHCSPAAAPHTSRANRSTSARAPKQTPTRRSSECRRASSSERPLSVSVSLAVASVDDAAVEEGGSATTCAQLAPPAHSTIRAMGAASKARRSLARALGDDALAMTLLQSRPQSFENMSMSGAWFAMVQMLESGMSRTLRP